MRRFVLGRGEHFKRAVLFTLAFAVVHLAVGVYASLTGGYFVFGATAIERLISHGLGGYESKFSVTGNPREFVNDLCLQKCAGCGLECYNPDLLVFYCVGRDCSLMTLGGSVLLSEGDLVYSVVKYGFLLENVTFRCSNVTVQECGFGDSSGRNLSFECVNVTTSDCGFEMGWGRNRIYRSNLPEGIRRVLSR